VFSKKYISFTYQILKIRDIIIKLSKYVFKLRRFLALIKKIIKLTNLIIIIFKRKSRKSRIRKSLIKKINWKVSFNWKIIKHDLRIVDQK
jgi:tRNA1(Val) A37 N6-methylase TrmN6